MTRIMSYEQQKFVMALNDTKYGVELQSADLLSNDAIELYIRSDGQSLQKYQLQGFLLQLLNVSTGTNYKFGDWQQVHYERFSDAFDCHVFYVFVSPV